MNTHATPWLTRLKAGYNYLINAGRQPGDMPVEALSHIRTITSTTFILILLSIPIAILEYLSGIPWITECIIGAAIIGLVNLICLHYQKHPSIAFHGHIIVLTIYSVVLYGNIIWGGYYDPNFVWLYFIPLLAGLIISNAAMWLYVLLIVCTFAGYVYFQHHGALPLMQIASPYYEWLSTVNRFGFLIMTFSTFHLVKTQESQLRNALNHAKQQEQAANHSKTEFLATISHEMRTPLTSVLGLTELLKDKLQQPEEKEYARLAYEASEMLASLLNDILDLSRIDIQQLNLTIEDFDFINLMEDALAMFSKKAYEKRIDLQYFIPPSMPRILRGSPMRLRQILSTLLSNAIKFTAHGEVSVRVQYEWLASNQLKVVIYVKDSGIGIPQKNLDIIFDAFSRQDFLDAHANGSTGLGLTIAKKLATLMAGSISVESEEGKGSTFIFSFLSQASQQLTDTKPLSNQPLEALCIHLRPTTQELLMGLLQGWNIETAHTTDPIIGQGMMDHQRSKGHPYAFVFMENDRLTPEFSMINRALNKTRVILLKNLAEPLSIFLNEVTTLDIIEKPIKQMELYAVLAKLLGKPVKIQQQTPHSLTLPPMKILVAQDDTLNLALIKAMLANFSVDYDTCRNGVDALEAVQSQHYDLIIMDWRLPGMDGLEATRQIRALQNPVKRNTPIIGVTAASLNADRDRCLEAGMDDYLVKPFRQKELHEILRKWSPHPAPLPPQEKQ